MVVRFIDTDGKFPRHSRRRVTGETGSPRDRSRKSPLVDQVTGAEPAFQFWVGASGQPYIHAVFSLIGCPEIPHATYILANRDASGNVTALDVRRTTEAAASLNLAEIRQTGARLGANEVHVHLVACTAAERRRVEADLKATFAATH